MKSLSTYSLSECESGIAYGCNETSQNIETNSNLSSLSEGEGRGEGFIETHHYNLGHLSSHSEFLNSQGLIKKFLSLPRREDLIKCSSTHSKGATHVVMPPVNAKETPISAKMSTHVPMPQILAKAGFTLAEVLITLGIIGVVAAMTIPNLIMSYQKKATVTKLQKAISVLNQAYKLSFDEFGEPSDAAALSMGGEEFFNTYYAPFIKVNTYCKKPSDCGYDSNFPFKYINGTKYDVNVVAPNARLTFNTPDGFVYIIFVAMASQTSPTGYNSSRLVIVDINGGEKPNLLGRDVFLLSRVEEKGVLPISYNRSNEYINVHCTTSYGNACAEKIRRAGWQIDSSYPWK